MKTFLVIDTTHEDWCICTTSDIGYAVAICKTIQPHGCKELQIWATEEDPDTAVTFDTVYRYDVEHGEEIISKERELAFRLYDEEGDETVEEIEKKLKTVSGCHDVIEYLLETIDSILE